MMVLYIYKYLDSACSLSSVQKIKKKTFSNFTLVVLKRDNVDLS